MSEDNKKQKGEIVGISSIRNIVVTDQDCRHCGSTFLWYSKRFCWCEWGCCCCFQLERSQTKEDKTWYMNRKVIKKESLLGGKLGGISVVLSLSRTLNQKWLFLTQEIGIWDPSMFLVQLTNSNKCWLLNHHGHISLLLYITVNTTFKTGHCFLRWA